MFLKIRIRRKSAQAALTPKQAGYPLRSSSFAASIGVHSIWIGLLILISAHAKAPQRPVYDELIRPYQYKIIFYKVPKKTPEVASLRRVGLSLEARGAEVSSQTIVATAPKPVSQQQTIWLSAPKIEIQQDIQVPNLIAKLDASPLLPEPAKAKPRSFIPPPPNDHPPRLQSPTPVLITSAPPLSGASIQTPSWETKPPALSAPETRTNASVGNARADIAIASVHPGEVSRSEIPQGAHPGQFSKAPKMGEVETGEAAQQAAVIIPNLTISNGRPQSDADKKVSPPKVILYAERLRNVPLTSFSVPLRPASRAIPKAIDARFQGRNVYTIVIPIENIPLYGGDWIIWFAERVQTPGASALLRAPVPFRKLEPQLELAGGSSVVRVQIAAVLETTGKLSNLSVLNSASPALKQRAIQDLTEWEFKPATRDGVPVAVEVVLEIPFGLPTTITELAGP